MDPEAEEAPTFGLMETDLTPVTAQDKVVLSPSVIAFGLAEKLLIFGTLVGIVELTVLFTFVVSTVTVTDLVTAPAVNVYVVVAAGVTGVEPFAPTPPMPGVILIDVEPVTSHARLELSPALIEAGFALKVLMIGELDIVTVTVADAVELPAPLEAVSV
jgi:hypothetical protein